MKNIYKIAEKKGVTIQPYQHSRIDSMPYPLTDVSLSKLSKEDLVKYLEACWCVGNEMAGGHDGWVRGHELLEELGFTKEQRRAGHRVFERMVYNPTRKDSHD